MEASRHSRPRAAIDGNPRTFQIRKVDAGLENLEAIATATPSFAVLLHGGFFDRVSVTRSGGGGGHVSVEKEAFEVFVFIRLLSGLI